MALINLWEDTSVSLLNLYETVIFFNIWEATVIALCNLLAATIIALLNLWDNLSWKTATVALFILQGN